MGDRLGGESAQAAYNYTYDTDSACGTSYGDLVRRTDPVGNVTCYAYDALHRVTAITPQSGSPYFTATPQKHFVYDTAQVNGHTMTNAAGRLAEAYTGASKTTDLGFKYSLRGEVTDVYQSSPHSGGYYHVTASYWANGLVNQLSVLNTSDAPVTGLPTWTYNPEGEGRATTVSAGSGQSPVTSVPIPAYNVFGLLNGLTFGSGDSDAFTYDNNTGRMTQYQATINTSSAYGAMTWNANGSLYSVAITDPFNSANNGQTCNHTYDDLARVSVVNCVNGGWGQNFTYDPFGNIKKSQFGYYGNGTFQPTYDLTTNRYQSLNNQNLTGSYDNNGNPTYDTFHHYAWDADGNLSQLDGGTAMVYDALGRRMEQPNGSVILYGPAGSKLALMGSQSVTTAFIPLPGGATAVYNSSGLAWYRHPDWLGSSRIASLPSGSGNSRIYYDGPYSPYGESYGEYGTTDRNFTGQNQDLTPAGDMYDFLYRQYHAPQGRWISPDPAGIKAANPANPQSWNRYAYVNGDPLRRKDSKGLCAVDFSADQTGPDQGCTDVGYAAWSQGWDSWSTPPSGVNGLSQQGGIFDANMGAWGEQIYAAWTSEQFKLMNTYNDKPIHGDVIFAGILVDEGHHTISTVEETTNTGDVPLSGYQLGPFGGSEQYFFFNAKVNAEVKFEFTPSAYAAPEKAIGVGPLPFAPGPTYVPGSCPQGQHWQPDPYNLAAGACHPDGPQQLLQPKP